MDKNSIARKDDKLDSFDPFSQLELPPIITKPTKLKKQNRVVTKNRAPTFEEQTQELGNHKVDILKEDLKINGEMKTPHVRRFSVSSPGVKIRVDLPKIDSRKNQGYGGRKSVSAAEKYLW